MRKSPVGPFTSDKCSLKPHGTRAARLFLLRMLGFDGVFAGRVG
jgi:hypothetical protein